MSYESLIAKAILAGPGDEQDEQSRRVACKMYASRKMFCDCGAILDQKTIVLVADGPGLAADTLAARCPACVEAAGPRLDELSDNRESPLYLQSWHYCERLGSVRALVGLNPAAAAKEINRRRRAAGSGGWWMFVAIIGGELVRAKGSGAWVQRMEIGEEGSPPRVVTGSPEAMKVKQFTDWIVQTLEGGEA